MRRFVSASVVVTAALRFCPSIHAEVRYAVTDLSALHGSASAAVDINNAGTAAGVAETSTREIHAVVWQDGLMTDLSPAFGIDSAAGPINSSGQIVIYTNDSQTTRAFLYSDGRYTDLGGLGGSFYAASGINDSGQVVGIAATSNETHAFLYSGGMIQNLSDAFGWTSSAAGDINNLSQIVGGYRAVNRFGMIESHGFLYTEGVIQDLGVNLVPIAINDSGEIIGATGEGGPFLLRNGQRESLGFGVARAINNAGVIVGDASLNGSLRAVLYENGGPVDLNTLVAPGSGLTLYQAFGINDAGQIVGSALTASGDFSHAFLLTPVPEPAALPALLLGVATLRRRRRA